MSEPLPVAPPLLEIEDLHVRFRVADGELRAVRGVSLALSPGETLAIVGESGCGKSTLARAILGLTPHWRGQLRFAGRPLPTSGQARRALCGELQLIFQDSDASLDPRSTVERVLLEPLAIHQPRLAAAARRAAVEALLARVGLDRALLGRYPHELSGGQRQRVCIARALSVEPRVLVLDEAVSALDLSVRAQILNLLLQLQRESGVAYLFITHDLGVVRHVAHRVAVMYLGEVVEAAETEALFASPQHPYTRALLGAVLSIEAGAARPTPLDGELPSPLAPPPGCGFSSRCSQAMARCRAEPPATYARAGSAGTVRCFLAQGAHE